MRARERRRSRAPACTCHVRLRVHTEYLCVYADGAGLQLRNAPLITVRASLLRLLLLMENGHQQLPSCHKSRASSTDAAPDTIGADTIGANRRKPTRLNHTHTLWPSDSISKH
ncbi:unnamed protein product [Lampetra planeri]